MTSQLSLVDSPPPARQARSTDLERLIDPTLRQDPAAIVARAMETSRDRNDLRSFTRTWPELQEFTLKLAATLTEYMPSSDPASSLLQESLEAACIGYLSAGPGAPAGSDVARFLGAGLAMAARGFGSLTIIGFDGATRTRWDPRQGGISQFIIDRNIERLLFSLRPPAQPAERVALRNFIVQQTMVFEDDVRMVRAGVDYKTFEPY